MLIPNQNPTGHLDSMRGLGQPVPPSCEGLRQYLSAFDDNICGLGGHQYLPKFVDNICQSGSSQVFASLAHPSAADNHTLSDGAEHPTASNSINVGNLSSAVNISEKFS